MSGDQFHLLSRGARLGVVSSGVAALGGGLLWRVGRWVAGAGGVVLSGSARWCGIGQALRGRALLLRCDVSRKCSVGREGGREKKDRRSCSQRGAMPGAAAACCWGDGMLSLES